MHMSTMQSESNCHDLECVGCKHGPQAIQASVEKGIAKVGWVMIPVADGDPPFVYTVGLTETYKHPELIITGFPPNAMIEILEAAVDKLKESRGAFEGALVPGVIQVNVHGKLQDGVLGCQKVRRKKRLELLRLAVNRYGADNFAAKQLVYPDPHGILPWQPGFDSEWGKAQPKLWK